MLLLDFDMNEFCDKKYKADYLTYQIKYVDKLKYLSLKLKTLPISDRQMYLKKILEEINNWVNDDVRS